MTLLLLLLVTYTFADPRPKQWGQLSTSLCGTKFDDSWKEILDRYGPMSLSEGAWFPFSTQEKQIILSGFCNSQFEPDFFNSSSKEYSQFSWKRTLEPDENADWIALDLVLQWDEYESDKVSITVKQSSSSILSSIRNFVHYFILFVVGICGVVACFLVSIGWGLPSKDHPEAEDTKSVSPCCKCLACASPLCFVPLLFWFAIDFRITAWCLTVRPVMDWVLVVIEIILLVCCCCACCVAIFFSDQEMRVAVEAKRKEELRSKATKPATKPAKPDAEDVIELEEFEEK